MSVIRLTRALFLVSTIVLVAEDCQASAFVRGAYYRLGEDDPGAKAGSVGNDPTQDSFGDNLDLQRFGSPRYSADVPPRGPLGSTLSMAFANEGLGGPAFPGFYGREDSLSMVEQGYALEAWVKAGPTNLDSIRTNIIAYNGQPEGNGFGLFLDGEDYVVRIGSFERLLGPATVSEWHHLAYVQSLGTASYYYDGKLVDETTSDPLPVAADGGFWLGGLAIGVNGEGTLLFNGWIDEVRYQSFNPLAAGAFNPTDFLIRSSPVVGDYNGSGVVDAADYVVWRKTLGQSGFGLAADGNANNQVDPLDYNVWRAHFGQTTGSGSGSGANAAVPEPSTLVMLVLATAGWCHRRRRRA
jgi:concanavalin A-like lectin/glucanase superfamily protein/dockerin type I repeat protein/PEP-CTERM motif-containing protein